MRKREKSWAACSLEPPARTEGGWMLACEIWPTLEMPRLSDVKHTSCILITVKGKIWDSMRQQATGFVCPSGLLPFFLMKCDAEPKSDVVPLLPSLCLRKNSCLSKEPGFLCWPGFFSERRTPWPCPLPTVKPYGHGGALISEGEIFCPAEPTDPRLRHNILSSFAIASKVTSSRHFFFPFC